ncbi:hypothetical protein HHJ49_00025 [Escherichia coli]|nr:hypothetical protein HHJ49_00025 [Escherichia coli]
MEVRNWRCAGPQVSSLAWKASLDANSRVRGLRPKSGATGRCRRVLIVGGMPLIGEELAMDSFAPALVNA